MSKVRIEADCPELHALISATIDMMRRKMIQNFVTYSLYRKDRSECYTVTVQKEGGISPAERIEVLEERVAKAEEALFKRKPKRKAVKK